MYFPIAIHVFVFDHLSQGNQNSGPILILIFLLILVNREPLGEKQIHEQNDGVWGVPEGVNGPMGVWGVS